MSMLSCITTGGTVNSLIPDFFRLHIRVKPGTYNMLHMASVLISVSLALEPGVDKDPLPKDTGLVYNVYYHSSPSLGTVSPCIWRLTT